MNKIKRISALLATIMCISVFGTSCGNTGNENTADTQIESTETEASETVTEPLITTAAVPTEPVDLSAGVTDVQYSRAILNEGNKSRLAKAMKKAENGEEITVCTIGGSITQGSLASSNQYCYSSLFFKWWQEKFPNTTVNGINAGIGGTTSYLGVNRVDDQVLAYNPDVVIVEFSVNDGDKVMNKYSYDSLVRKILDYETEPAVILLFTTQENGTSLQDVHKEIGFAYDLPMISYREVVYPEVSAGTLNWDDISPDDIHPNDAGHDIIGQLLSRYLNGVYDEKDSISDEITPLSEYTAYTKDYYKNAKMYAPSDIENVELDTFEVGTNNIYPDKYPENWVTENGGSIKFTIDCQTLGIFFKKQVDGKGGKYEVYIDGERKGTIDSDFSGGWGNYGETKSVLLDSESKTREIEIKAAEGSEATSMTILGIMAS